MFTLYIKIMYCAITVAGIDTIKNIYVTEYKPFLLFCFVLNTYLLY